MNQRDSAIGDGPAIRLTLVAPFSLGGLEIDPSTCQVRRVGVAESIEPRVMQVLVALAEARGAVVSRDVLIARCWDGRVVGESAIHRVISHVRALGAGFGAGAYQIETITKVGYRLVVTEAAITCATQEAPSPDDRRPAPLLRRRWMVGAAVVAVAAAGGMFQWRRHASGPSSEAQALYRKGVEAQRQGLAEQNVQAAAYFKQAVTVDPGYAAGWGALALAYRHLLETGRAEDDPTTTAGWVRSAASRAFQLDPHNADARVALILVKPYFRNWTAMERDVREALVDHPDHWLLWSNLGRILGEVGRWNEAQEPLQRATSLDPFLPIARARQAIAFWGSGDLQAAESAFDAAAVRWPAHPSIWFPRFNFLALTGRAGAAIALAEETDTRPASEDKDVFGALSTLARAVQGRDRSSAPPSSEIERAAAVVSSATAVPFLAALGHSDAAFARLDRYFFGEENARASSRPPSPSLTRRYTDFLFMPTTASLREDSRFDRLTDAIGLVDYWRTAGVAPDYERQGAHPAA